MIAAAALPGLGEFEGSRTCYAAGYSDARRDAADGIPIHVCEDFHGADYTAGYLAGLRSVGIGDL